MSTREDEGVAAALDQEQPGDLLGTPEAGPAVIRGGALRSGGYILGIGLSVASAPLIIRHLGVVDYGRYLTVISIVTIVAGVTEAGLTSIGVRELALVDRSERPRIIANLMGMRLAITLAGVAIAVAFTLLAGYVPAMVIGTVVAGGGLVVSVVQTTYAVPLTADLRLGWVALLELIKQLVTVVTIVALVLVGAALLPFFVTLLVAGLAALAVNAVLARRDIAWLPSADRRQWWHLVRDALPFAAATAVGIVYFRVTIVLLGLVSDDRQVGYFSASFRIVEVVAGIPWLLVTSAFPVLVRAAHEDTARFRYAVARLSQTTALLGVWVAVCLVLGAPFAIEVIAGASFDPSTPVLRIQGVAVAATFLLSTWGFVLLSLRRHRALLVANVIALAVACGLTLGLGSGPLGARGAAIATVGAEIALALAYAVTLFGSRSDLRFPPRFVVPVTIGAVLSLTPAIVFGLHPVVAVIVGTVVYFAVLGVGGAIPDELRDEAVKRLPRHRDA